MSRIFSAKRVILWLILAFIAFNVGMWVYHRSHKDAGAADHQPVTKSTTANNKPVMQLSAATLLPEPRPLSAFALMDSKKQPFNNQSLAGHWTVLYFGFTSCPSICPATMSLLNEVYTQMQADKKPLPQVVFISVDPKRDSFAKINRFIDSFNSDFKGATGNEQQIKQLTNELSILFMKVQQANANPDDYQIDHSGTLVLIDPTGKFYAVFTTPHEPDKVTKDLETITTQAS